MGRIKKTEDSEEDRRGDSGQLRAQRTVKKTEESTKDSKDRAVERGEERRGLSLSPLSHAAASLLLSAEQASPLLLC